MPRRRSKFDEAQVIETALHSFERADPAVLVGIGDDAAVLRPAGKNKQLVTTDSLVEGVHFDLRYVSHYDLGWKSLAVSVSDIAAMGGTPRFAVVQLGLPRGAGRQAVVQLSRGLRACADEYGLSLVGGDSFSAPQWQVGCTVLGECAKPLLRRGAHPGDDLWLTGEPGLSQIGLHLHWAAASGLRLGGGRHFAAAKTRHRRPHPDAKLGLMLAGLGATSAIDTSDSLAQSLLHIAGASKVGLALDFTELSPCAAVSSFARVCRHWTGQSTDDTAFTLPASANPSGNDLQFSSLIDFILYSSEDYLLLFSTPRRLEAAVRKSCPGARRIGGVLETAAGCSYRDQHGAVHALQATGWQHDWSRPRIDR